MKTPINRLPISLITSILAFVSSNQVYAELLDITLDNQSLPSTQGWMYDSMASPLSEAQVFSTDGSVLHMNTLGQGYQGQGRNQYVHPISSFTPGADWELAFRVRVPQYEMMYADPLLNPHGFFVRAQFDGTWVSIGLSGAIMLYAPTFSRPEKPSPVLQFDTSGWHDYRFVTDRARGTFSLFIDNILKSSGSLDYPMNPDMPDGIYLGDGTGGENAKADIASLHVFQRAPAQGPPVQAEIYRAVEVRWSTMTGKTYQVQSTLALDSPSWADFGQPVTGDGLPKSVFDNTRDAASRFYRVIEDQ